MAAAAFELLLLATIEALPSQSACNCTLYETELVTMEAAMRAAKAEIRALRGYVSILQGHGSARSATVVGDVPAEGSPFRVRRILQNDGTDPSFCALQAMADQSIPSGLHG
jgi:hypothetical protein